jgi:hypothetical protein
MREFEVDFPGFIISHAVSYFIHFQISSTTKCLVGKASYLDCVPYIQYGIMGYSATEHRFATVCTVWLLRPIRFWILLTGHRVSKCQRDRFLLVIILCSLVLLAPQITTLPNWAK